MQLLAGLGLALGQLKRARKHGEALDIVADMEQLLGEAQGEIRAISYLAHPPALLNLGLAGALKMLVEGYGRRTGLRISLNLEVDEVEWESAKVAIYRVIQEALSNIHRHARAADVMVGLYRRRSMYHAVIVDNGVGMPNNANSGVGLSSMRARVAELGGRLTVRRAKPGTVVIASLPVRSSLRANGDLANHS
jgi:signal transduction histidine kinase